MQEHGGTRLPFNFGDLLEVPSVAEALADLNAQTLPDTLLPELEQKLPVILEGRVQKLKSECIGNVIKEREALGLLDFKSIGEGAGSNRSFIIKGARRLDHRLPFARRLHCLHRLPKDKFRRRAASST